MRQEKGFVFLDAIVGIMIMCIGITCLFGVVAGARQSLYLSQWKSKASNVATAELEGIMSKDIRELIAVGEISPGNIVSKTEDDIGVEVDSQWLNGTAGLLRVKVTANWNYGPGNGNVVYETMLYRR